MNRDKKIIVALAASTITLPIIYRYHQEIGVSILGVAARVAHKMEERLRRYAGGIT